MRTETVTHTIYKFDELGRLEQQKVLYTFHNINVDYDWWNYTYEDAERVELKITGFDIDRGNLCSIEMDCPKETAEKIISEHGENCDTHKEAKEFQDEWTKLVEKYSDGVNKNIVSDGNGDLFDTDADTLEEEFKKSISECYLSTLRNEYEYLTSEKAIIETINSNGYEFLEDGTLYS